jgi:hypothetical protein
MCFHSVNVVRYTHVSHFQSNTCSEIAHLELLLVTYIEDIEEHGVELNIRT